MTRLHEPLAIARFGVGVAGFLALVTWASVPAAPPAAPEPIPLEVARDRARTMHDLYESTLDVIHHRYFHVDRAMLPARAMEDIFVDVRRKSRIGARWVAVNTRPMSLDHEPQDAFEKRVARELAAGAEEVEAVEGTVYRRAAPIPLGGGCISCHEGLVQQRPDLPRVAALVIRVPGVVPAAEPAEPAAAVTVAP